MKTILLYAPASFGVNEVFRKNLEHLGYKVICIPPEKSYKPSLWEKVLLRIMKIYQRNTIQYNTKKFYNNKIKNFFSSIHSPVEYGLVIRPDQLTPIQIMEMKKKVKTLIGYQWDGLDRYPEIHNLIHLFDKFFVFDINDVSPQFPNNKWISNFYSDYENHHCETLYDITFVGSVLDNRLQFIITLAEHLKKQHINYKFHCILPPSDEDTLQKLAKNNISTTPVSFEDNIKLTKQSKVIIDFKNSAHNGFSFRLFEAAGYGTKLITNNPLVKHIEFYHPNNILITQDFNIDEILSFLQLPFHPIPQKCIEKYSFTNWLANIIDAENKLPILYPAHKD